MQELDLLRSMFEIIGGWLSGDSGSTVEQLLRVTEYPGQTLRCPGN